MNYNSIESVSSENLALKDKLSKYEKPVQSEKKNVKNFVMEGINLLKSPKSGMILRFSALFLLCAFELKFIFVILSLLFNYNSIFSVIKLFSED